MRSIVIEIKKKTNEASQNGASQLLVCEYQPMTYSKLYIMHIVMDLTSSDLMSRAYALHNDIIILSLNIKKDNYIKFKFKS